MEFSKSIVDVKDYIKNFEWDDNKFQRARSLVEITGLITEVISFPDLGRGYEPPTTILRLSMTTGLKRRTSLDS